MKWSSDRIMEIFAKLFYCSPYECSFLRHICINAFQYFYSSSPHQDSWRGAIPNPPRSIMC